MSANTKIEWADHTFNPWTGCTKVSPGCDHCYAESWAKRSGHVEWGPYKARRRTTESYWQQPKKWNAKAQAEGKRYRVFCASLADVFDNAVLFDWRLELFELIRATPHLDWLLLTKRIGNAGAMIDEVMRHIDIGHEPAFAAWPWPNVWLGATVVNQKEADRDIPKLLETPAAKRFLSMEPLLGPVNLTDISDGRIFHGVPREYWEDCDTEDSPPALCHNALTGEKAQRFGSYTESGPRIDWVIAGGESGPHARHSDVKWFLDLRDDCITATVPFFFKQWGSAGTGKLPQGSKGGRLLDGREYSQVPA